MNPDMSEFMVAVVPCETSNDIDQSSSVEDILACKETRLIPITDYFQAQNDEEYHIHWSFLIRMKELENWTGTNLYDIHMFK